MKTMLRVSLTLLFCIVLCMCLAPVVYADNVAIDVTTFPDQNFRNYISEQFDSDGNGFLNDEELIAVTAISCDNLSISTLEGIGLFSNLYYLSCSDNQIKRLDLSDNPNMEQVYCYGNGLTSINVTKNYKLKEKNYKEQKRD